MHSAQKLSIFSIWTKPRAAFRYYLTKQTFKLEQLFLLIPSVPFALYYSTSLSVRPALAVPLAVLGQYLLTWLMSYFYGWFYTVVAKWFKGQGNTKRNRMAYLLTNVSILPAIGIMALITSLPNKPSSISMNGALVLLGIMYFGAAIHLITLQLRFASEANQFSKLKAFFTSVLASIIPALIIGALVFLFTSW